MLVVEGENREFGRSERLGAIADPACEWDRQLLVVRGIAPAEADHSQTGLRSRQHMGPQFERLAELAVRATPSRQR